MEMSDWELDVPTEVRCPHCFSIDVRRYRRVIMLACVWYYKCNGCKRVVTKAYMAGFWKGFRKAEWLHYKNTDFTKDRKGG